LKRYTPCEGPFREDCTRRIKVELPGLGRQVSSISRSL
jgi:hypothetical protein